MDQHSRDLTRLSLCQTRATRAPLHHRPRTPLTKDARGVRTEDDRAAARLSSFALLNLAIPSPPYSLIVSSFSRLFVRGLECPLSQLQTLFTEAPTALAKAL